MEGKGRSNGNSLIPVKCRKPGLLDGPVGMGLAHQANQEEREKKIANYCQRAAAGFEIFDNAKAKNV